MIMRIGQLMTSFFTNRFEGYVQASVVNVVQDFAKKGRQTLLIVMSSFVFSLLLAAGVIISLLEASSQYDTKGAIYFSAMLTSSILLALISLSVLVVLFWPRTKSTVVSVESHNHAFNGHSTMNSTNNSGTLSDIVSLLVAQGIKYYQDRNSGRAKFKSKDYSRV